MCRLLGVSRQWYYNKLRHTQRCRVDDQLIIKQVKKIRKSHDKIGTRKLHDMMKDYRENYLIKMGRDKLFDVMREHKLLIKRRITRVKTTDSMHGYRKWPDLIQGMQVERKGQLWVGDITYWKVAKGFYYISLITDAYSRKIVGYNVSDNMRVRENIKALQMALEQKCEDTKLIHHSDRGIQYCSFQYVSKLIKNDIQISMTQSGDPRDNAIAERINGIIKNEYLKGIKVYSLKEAQSLLKQKIDLYNQERPHLSLGMLTPSQVHDNPNLKPINLWKRKNLRASPQPSNKAISKL